MIVERNADKRRQSVVARLPSWMTEVPQSQDAICSPWTAAPPDLNL
jgi:hypothetical protein